MNARQLFKFLINRDTTFKGEFRAMWRLIDPTATKAIVDVGANDGFYGSNSYPFVARGWQALLIEPHPDAFARLQRRHRHRRHVTCLQIGCGDRDGELPLWTGPDGDTTRSSFVPAAARHNDKPSTPVKIPVRRLENVLAERGFPDDFAVLSVDAEGYDFAVLRGLNLGRWRPRMIVTEDMPGEDMSEKNDHLRHHSYHLRAKVDANALWTLQT